MTATPARELFGLPASEAFLLARGAAAQQLTARPAQDLHFFTRPGGGEVRRARDEFVAAVQDRGWSVEHLQDSETFAGCWSTAQKPSSSISPRTPQPGRPASVSLAGPTFTPDELAGRKVIALFDLLLRGTSSTSMR